MGLDELQPPVHGFGEQPIAHATVEVPGSDSAAVKLDANTSDDEALRALRGPGSRDVPIAADADQAQPPELSRRVVSVDPTQAAPLLRAADGTPLGHWRASGRGRVGV